LITIALLAQGKNIIMKLAKIPPPGYAIQNTSVIAFIFTTFLLLFWITSYSNKLIRYSIPFILISYGLEYIPTMVRVRSEVEMIIYIIALSLLPFAFIYACKYRSMESEGSGLQSMYLDRRSILPAILIIIVCIIVFMWYGHH
jgi:hypothetical protein